MAPHSSTLAWKSHGRRSLVGCSPWGCEESDMTEQLHFHFSLLCIGEENGNPLQCSCLENPRDGVAQSRIQMKWLSSSSSILLPYPTSSELSKIAVACISFVFYSFTIYHIISFLWFALKIIKCISNNLIIL